ncbi:unnamed protein product [Rhizophagus irregularis]|nr:unnamed protein product [Rhizophagus irregularis]
MSVNITTANLQLEFKSLENENYLLYKTYQEKWKDKWHLCSHGDELEHMKVIVNNLNNKSKHMKVIVNDLNNENEHMKVIVNSLNNEKEKVEFLRNYRDWFSKSIN